MIPRLSIHVGSEEGVDIDYFQGLHARVTEKFMQLCQEWEKKSNKLEQEHTSGDGTFAEDINVEDGKFKSCLLVQVCSFLPYVRYCSSRSNSNDSLPSSASDEKEVEAIPQPCGGGPGPDR